MTSAAMRELERAMELLAQVVADHDAAGEHDGANVRFETIDDVREFLGDPGPIATEPQHRKARWDDPRGVRYIPPQDADGEPTTDLPNPMRKQAYP